VSWFVPVFGTGIDLGALARRQILCRGLDGHHLELLTEHQILGFDPIIEAKGFVSAA
jgi:hypothetical protein